MSSSGHSESDSPADHNFLSWPFYWGTRLILAYPWATIALGIALAGVALALTGTRLGYRTSRLDLINPKSDYNRLWLEYIKEFGAEDDAVIVVEGKGREEVVPVLEEISTALAREDRLFHAVLHEVDLSKIRSKGLHYLPPPELEKIDRFLAETQPIVAGEWSRLSMGNLVAGMAMRMQAAFAQAMQHPDRPIDPSLNMEDLERLVSSLLATLSQRGRYQSPFAEMPQSFAVLSEMNSEYLLAKNGQLGFVLLRLALSKDSSFTAGDEATTALRALIAEIRVKHPQIKIGLTGLPIMEADEMHASQSSMFWSSLVSMIGVGLLFIAGFGGLRHALLANVILLVGMAWAFGYVTLTVGHLNILSVSFTVTMIGIGIDYGIYYVARYLQLRSEKRDCLPALLETSRGAGPAITTGALTTAVAFFTAGLTSFTGVAELGIIAGGGILLCAVAELTLLPAAIALMDRSGWGVRMPSPLPIHKWILPFEKLPKLTLAATLIMTGFLSLGMTKLWYDNNLLNMQAVGLESVELERRLLSECNQSVWYALSIADSREQLLARKAKFSALPTVERTEEIVSLLPVDDEVKRPIIERISSRLTELPERPPLITISRPEKLGEALAQLQAMIARTGRDEKCARQIEQIRHLLRSMPVDDCYRFISLFQQQMAGDLLSRLHVLKQVANPEPPQLTDLPASLVDRFVGKDGHHHLLKIYGKGNIWDTEALAHFVSDVRGVDPHVTGNPLQAHEASAEMKSSYEQAAIYSMLVIIGVLVLDFRSLTYSLIAALPLGVGLLQTFGLLGFLNVPLNPANLIALPLILGIGVDYGVHIVHEFRECRGPYRMSPGTAVAVLIDALTTIVGFGSLMIATHQGLQSLGRVLTIAVTCCLFSSLVMLPALLAWMTRNRPEVPLADAEPYGEPAGLEAPVAAPRARAA
ncbi:MAG TPA: MMPL family transporter [Pirellulales bacterium]|nr:MMPL family transporter [Pirellulales bacterium]